MVVILRFTRCFLFMKTCWNSFFPSPYDSIISLHVIAEWTIIRIFYFHNYLNMDFKYNLFQTDDIFYTHINIYCCSRIDLSYISFHQSNTSLHSHNKCFVTVIDSFIPVIMLNTLRFKSCVSLGSYTLLDKSLRVLQLSTHLSNLTRNG